MHSTILIPVAIYDLYNSIYWWKLNTVISVIINLFILISFSFLVMNIIEKESENLGMQVIVHVDNVIEEWLARNQHHLSIDIWMRTLIAHKREKWEVEKNNNTNKIWSPRSYSFNFCFKLAFKNGANFNFFKIWMGGEKKKRTSWENLYRIGNWGQRTLGVVGWVSFVWRKI